MLCSFEKLIYPKPGEIAGNGYMVALYKLHEHLVCAGETLSSVKAVGYFLPRAAIQYRLFGHWETDKYGRHFCVERYEEVVIHNKAGITAYLSSGLIKGIGPALAERIYNTFGDQTLSILDSHPEKLLMVSGISHAKLDKIMNSYMEYRGARDVVAFLSQYGVTANRAVKIYRHYLQDTLRILQENPYQLCEISGFGFCTADAIAKKLGLDPLATDRISAGLMHTLLEAENGGDLFKNAGNLCIDKKDFIDKAMMLLDTPALTRQAVADCADTLLNARQISVYNGQVYRMETACAENSVAAAVSALLDQSRTTIDFAAEIKAAESKSGIELASEQKQAVQTSLNAPFCIITGGPGTGKTTILRMVLDIYAKANPVSKIVCCAPTGRAARRMTECTGHDASTIHKALGILAREQDVYSEAEPLDADFVVVDEVSMLDIQLARRLFSALYHNTKLLFIGDADQLPSVGPGAVLSELIQCGLVPVVKLDKVYRQSEASSIAVNAALIRHNDVSLAYGSDFQLIESGTFEESADWMEKIYLEAVNMHGIDQVIMLSPFRGKTGSGVNALNQRLQGRINPPAPLKNEIVHGKRVFRLGDKVMQTKNSGMVSNGDIGTVVEVKTNGDALLRVDFGDYRFAEYEQSDLGALDLAYATTVHKSQGSEYHTVILNLQIGHYIMLKRPLIYTAITRAKEQVIIVGERKAIHMAIRKVDAEKRGTNLAKRIRELSAVL